MSFKLLLKALCKTLILRFPDMGKRFFTENDSRDVGIGAALTQKSRKRRVSR